MGKNISTSGAVAGTFFACCAAVLAGIMVFSAINVHKIIVRLRENGSYMSIGVGGLTILPVLLMGVIGIIFIIIAVALCINRIIAYLNAVYTLNTADEIPKSPLIWGIVGAVLAGMSFVVILATMKWLFSI